MKLCWTALLLLPLGCASIPGPESAPLDSLTDRLFADYDDRGLPGAAVLVVERGRVLVRRGFGSADLESGAAVTPDSRFRLASVSKQFTAMAILVLARDGKLTLEDSVARWLTGLPQWSERVTILHLLTHTSGIVDYEDHLPETADRQIMDEDVRKILTGRTELYFEPGTAYRYSNSGYALLARIAEEASGEPFPTVLRTRIFDPLSMAGSVAHIEGKSVVADRAYGHARDGAVWRRADQSATSAVLGDGGIYASIDELGRWVMEILEPRVLPEEIVSAAIQPRVETGEGSVRYGFGWRIMEVGEEDVARPVEVVWHTGETAGFRNALVLIPERKVGVVVLTNRNEGRLLDRALELALAVGARPAS
jgi:CubicO group peptidase (beta-lactamase class C family)